VVLFNNKNEVERRQQQAEQRKIEEKHAREKEEIDEKEYEIAVKSAHLA